MKNYRKALYYPVFVVLFACLQLSAQSPVGTWLIRDIQLEKLGTASAEEKKQLAQMRDTLLVPSFGKLLHRYLNDGTVLFYSIAGADTTVYDGQEWWIKNKRLYTSAHENPEAYPNAFSLKQNSLCITTTLTAEEIITKTWFQRLPSRSETKHSAAQIASYFRAGIAPLTTSWTLENYRDAMAILCDLHDQGQVSLPHHSDSSIQILRKLTELDTLKTRFAAVQASGDAYFVVSYSKTLVQLLMRYGQVAKQEGEILYSGEKTLVYLSVLTVMDELVELITTSVANEKLSSTRKQAVIEHRDKSMPMIVDGCLTILKDEYSGYRRADACLLGQRFFEFYAKHRRLLKEEEQVAFDQRLREIEETHPLPCLRSKPH